MKNRESRSKIQQIISGGQSGVDRAALDFALQNKISCGGWCPKGRIAEDGPIPEKYPLKETDLVDVSIRTIKNIETADGTLILHSKKIEQGTKTTVEESINLKKPYLLIDLEEEVNYNSIADWVDLNNIKILNIAGPRESNSKGIYKFSHQFLARIKHLF